MEHKRTLLDRRRRLHSQLQREPLSGLANILVDPQIDPEPRRVAAILLGESGDNTALPLLLAALSVERDATILDGIAIGLHDLGDTLAREPLHRCLLDSWARGEDVSTLVWALETLDAREYVQDLVRMIVDADETTYMTALSALSAIEGFHGPLPERLYTTVTACLRRPGELGDEPEWKILTRRAALEALQSLQRGTRHS